MAALTYSAQASLCLISKGGQVRQILAGKYFPKEEQGAPCVLLTTGSDNWVFNNIWKPCEFLSKL